MSFDIMNLTTNIFELKDEITFEENNCIDVLQDHPDAIRRAIHQRMINLLRSQHTVNLTGSGKNWFTDRHQRERELVDLKPFNYEELD